ncbi:unnamed protein product [Rotaria sp. Silwood2]|nr:unnamed protein product [Rotaria sp. Silwood2]CAF3231035.1 unnamed protein product [Rotaria sp. Silwood2]CAF4338663.1 unnamed protein product [Rotaria sp. Silwood2]CAF4371715.1 unnamed protein product [Rotaria sp. Silwood2]
MTRQQSLGPSLKRLYSLTVSSYTDRFYSRLQFLLDQSVHLYQLTIPQHASLPFQLLLFKITNVTFRKLHLGYYYYFNEDECITLSDSLLDIQCQTLYIWVKNREGIIILVKSMIKVMV